MAVRPFFTAVLLCSCMTVLAQTPGTFGPGTKERKAVLDVARKPVEKTLKQKVVFVVKNLRVLDGWAFLDSEPKRADGKPISYKGTIYEEAQRDGMMDSGFYALLKKKGKTWKLVQWVLGPTDVAWADWHERYGCPKAILGLPD